LLDGADKLLSASEVFRALRHASRAVRDENNANPLVGGSPKRLAPASPGHSARNKNQPSTSEAGSQASDRSTDGRNADPTVSSVAHSEEATIHEPHAIWVYGPKS
jgi:hypothetical protein